MAVLWRGVLGTSAAALIGLVAIRLRWLRLDGALASVVVGGSVFACSAWLGTLPLLLFFATASLLGRLPGRPAHSARSARQVAANGGAVVLASVWWGIGHAGAAASALLAAIASANADTWATEIGARWGGAPRRLLIGGPLVAGQSGGMSLVGTAAGGAGALLLGSSAALLGLPHWWTITAAGFGGSVLDSLLGATVQARFRCSACGATIEHGTHAACAHAQAERLHGWPPFDGDMVNAAATIGGGLIGTLLYFAVPFR